MREMGHKKGFGLGSAYTKYGVCVVYYGKHLLKKRKRALVKPLWLMTTELELLT